MSKVLIPNEGSKISMVNEALNVPNNPIIPFIEGDGIGKDIWIASEKVINTAIDKAYNAIHDKVDEEIKNILSKGKK